MHLQRANAVSVTRCVFYLSHTADPLRLLRELALRAQTRARRRCQCARHSENFAIVTGNLHSLSAGAWKDNDLLTCQSEDSFVKTQELRRVR